MAGGAAVILYCCLVVDSDLKSGRFFRKGYVDFLLEISNFFLFSKSHFYDKFSNKSYINLTYCNISQTNFYHKTPMTKRNTSNGFNQNSQDQPSTLCLTKFEGADQNTLSWSNFSCLGK